VATIAFRFARMALAKCIAAPIASYTRGVKPIHEFVDVNGHSQPA
jgi:hypothetical protein